MSKQRRTVLSGIVTPFPRGSAAEPEAGPEPAAMPAEAAEAPVSVAQRAPAKAAKGATKAATVQQTVYLAPAVHEQLRELAFSERVKMHALIMEGLDAVFKKRGMKSIASLTPKS